MRSIAADQHAFRGLPLRRNAVDELVEDDLEYERGGTQRRAVLAAFSRNWGEDWMRLISPSMGVQYVGQERSSRLCY